ncbi:hypothetical protein CHARACLAT_002761 [Characodon lateralis]|uniref:Uncharacterized protein n=1 Tax=Characodon lateralis TaxID=208331 RepID=A0ABU7DPM0_9TELE|nr:hypothetical protein [Characodon lateralis]
MLDHLHVAGHQKAWWTLPGLLASSAILYPRAGCYYKSQREPRLIGLGRRSSDATVNYITEYETAHHCFSGTETRLPASEASFWRRKSHRTFIHSPRGPTRKLSEQSLQE